jgi:hypothetical protein
VVFGLCLERVRTRQLLRDLWRDAIEGIRVPGAALAQPGSLHAHGTAAASGDCKATDDAAAYAGSRYSAARSLWRTSAAGWPGWPRWPPAIPASAGGPSAHHAARTDAEITNATPADAKTTDATAPDAKTTNAATADAATTDAATTNATTTSSASHAARSGTTHADAPVSRSWRFWQKVSRGLIGLLS